MCVKNVRALGAMLFLAATMVFAVPSYMWIGTYAITDGPPPCTNVSALGVGADAFYSAAVSYTTGIGPTPYEWIKMRDKQVTLNSLAATSRESADFLYVGAHGNIRLMAVWKPDFSYGYDIWTPSAMNFGTGNVRWVLLESCLVSNYDNLNSFFHGPNSWEAAFKGVQCVLGYGSEVWGSNSIQKNKSTLLWERWAHPTAPGGLWNAHAHSNEYASYIWGGCGIQPQVIGQVTNDGNNEKYAGRTYAQSTLERATSGSPAYTMWIIYGTPTY